MCDHTYITTQAEVGVRMLLTQTRSGGKRTSRHGATHNIKDAGHGGSRRAIPTRPDRASRLKPPRASS
eukprot:7355669-Alexandrium_andersonii.AAC.1